MSIKIAILGSTGSIGTQALQLVDENPGEYKVTSLCAGANVSLLCGQARKYKPRFAGITDCAKIEELRNGVPAGTDTACGEDAAIAAALDYDADVILLCITGVAALKPLAAVIKAGKTIALANKEALVCGGALVKKMLGENPKASIIPVDSEHSAIFQCLKCGQPGDVRRIILTASGGPFRKTPLDELKNVTPEMALKHPNWVMGRKITIDSATMMNKGLEMHEARWLFDVEPENISAVIHPQSVIHSMVEMKDGAIIAHLGVPDMRIPIQYALRYPRERLPISGLAPDLLNMSGLTFDPMDDERFPCFALAREALKDAGGPVPVAMNAANEVAVELFLEGKIGFTDIPRLVERAMAGIGSHKIVSLEDIYKIDREAREYLYKEMHF